MWIRFNVLLFADHVGIADSDQQTLILLNYKSKVFNEFQIILAILIYASKLLKIIYAIPKVPVPFINRVPQKEQNKKFMYYHFFGR